MSVLQIVAKKRLSWVKNALRQDQKNLFSSQSVGGLETTPKIREISTTDYNLRAAAASNKRKSRRGNRLMETPQIYDSIYNAKSVQEIHKHLNACIRGYGAPDTQDILSMVDAVAPAENDDNEDNNPTANEGAPSKKEAEAAPTFKEVSNAFSSAMNRCGLLKEFDAGFALFEQAQKLQIRSPKLFGTLIWLKMEQDMSIKSLHQCFDILAAMERKGIRPSAVVYGQLIKNATMLGAFRKAAALIEEVQSVQEQKVKTQLLESRTLRAAVLNYYAKTVQITEALEFLSEVVEIFGISKIDVVDYSTILSGMAAAIGNDQTELVGAAEKLFQKAVKNAQNPNEALFCSLINCYANVPDIESCMSVLQCMLSGSKWHVQTTSFTYCAVMRALTKYDSQPMSYAQGWKYIDEIIQLKDAHHSDDHIAFYGLLFTLCGGKFCQQSDLQKLYEFYDEMKVKGLKLGIPSAYALLMAGVDHFELELSQNKENALEIKQYLLQYIEWAMKEYAVYAVPFSSYHRNKLQERMQQMFPEET